MERFDGNTGAFDGALQQRPEVFEAVGVDLSVHVAFGVVDHLMHIINVQPVVGLQRVGEHVRVFGDVRPNRGL